MKTSQNGIDLIKRFEGLELESYRDIAGIWTIGYGHTGPEVGIDQHISEQEAEALLRHDLVSREKAVSGLVNVPLNQFEFDALVSFVYNVGIGAFTRSTARRRLNKGDREGAADALTWFNKATVQGVLRPVAGLTRRRAAERSLFLTPIGPVSARPEKINDNTRITPTEDPPRRAGLGESRTVQGAAVAGVSGVAASNMGRDASVELDQMESNIENGTSLTENGNDFSEDEGPLDEDATDGTDDGIIIPDLEGEEIIIDDTVPDAGTESDASPDLETDTADETITLDADGNVSSEDEGLEEVIEVPTTHPPAKHERHETDAQIQFALTVVIILAVLYILFARIDDWLKFRR